MTRLNLLLRFLKSPKKDIALKMRLFTCIDIDSKLSKLLWKFGNNTVIRCDLVNIQSLPPLSHKDKQELSQPSHPHHTPGNEQNDKNEQSEEKKNENDNNQSNELNEKKEIKIVDSFVLSVYEFYYLFLFLEDKLPELASWLMKQSDSNEHNLLLRALSNNNQKNNDLLNAEEEEEEKKGNDDDEELMNKMKIEQEQMNLQKNEIDDEHCIICFEKMKDPVCLTCGHEFCKECIDDWQHQIGGKDCPICRCMIEQSQMWIKLDSEDFSQAQYMMDLLKFPFDYVAKFSKWDDTMIK